MRFENGQARIDKSTLIVASNTMKMRCTHGSLDICVVICCHQCSRLVVRFGELGFNTSW